VQPHKPLLGEAHNLKVVGSNPTPATKTLKKASAERGPFLMSKAQKKRAQKHLSSSESRYKRPSRRHKNRALFLRSLSPPHIQNCVLSKVVPLSAFASKRLPRQRVKIPL